ncbi:BolA domain UV induced protein Uvi31 [Coemansia sp. BCRC 34490]|nr:BolA domain UV induced protein Uvi31 [Coemansia sp. BCRC 34490]
MASPISTSSNSSSAMKQQTDSDPESKPEPGSGVGGPMEQTIRTAITETFAPTELEIENESHKHRHHVAMRGVQSLETHFRVRIVSDRFDGKTQVARHRMVYALLKDEMHRDGGIHALGLVTRTPGEAEKEDSWVA